MNLNLSRPLVIFDLETTGTDVARDRIVEIAVLYLFYGEDRRKRWLVNPEMPIPADAVALHHIGDSDVAGAPTFKQLAPSLVSIFSGADVAGFNARGFDVPMLEMHFDRAGVPSPLDGAVILDAKDIFPTKEPRDLTAAVRFYCGEAHEGAHGAAADVAATARVLSAQFKRYGLPNTVSEIASMFAPKERFVDPTRKLKEDAQGNVLINFGQHRGRSLSELAQNKPDYLQWILRGEWHPKVKDAVKAALGVGNG